MGQWSMSKSMPSRAQGLFRVAAPLVAVVAAAALGASVAPSTAQQPAQASNTNRERVYRPYQTPSGPAAPSVFSAWPAPRERPILPPRIAGIGTPATAEQIAGWDIDARGDGAGLPPGSGTAKIGEEIYAQQCASCHGDFGEGMERYPALIGGRGSLGAEGARRTVGSYWPYAPGVFDYIRRAMPYTAPQSLSNDEYYAVTAYVLFLNEIVGEEDRIDAAALSKVVMPNRDGFVLEARPDTPDDACMKDCRRGRPVKVTIDSRQFVPPGSGSGFSEPQ